MTLELTAKVFLNYNIYYVYITLSLLIVQCLYLCFNIRVYDSTFYLCFNIRVYDSIFYLCFNIRVYDSIFYLCFNIRVYDSIFYLCFNIRVNDSIFYLCFNIRVYDLISVFIFQYVFKQEQEEYVKEGIDWKEINFVDNQPLLVSVWL